MKNRWAWIVVAGAGGAVAAQNGPERGLDTRGPEAKAKERGAEAKGPPEQKDAQGSIETAEGLLDALATADKDVRTLSADIIWSKAFDLGGDRHVRKGKLYFADERGASVKAGGAPGEGVGAPAGVRKFAVHFDQLYVGQRLEDEPKQYVFDGKYLVEKLPRQKKVARYQIVREGDGNDPLRIGEGPMPLPVGQKKADVLARFTAELRSSEDGVEGEDEAETQRLRKFVEGCYQLKLTPKAGVGDESRFTEIRLWYRKGEGTALLPRMSRTVDRAGDVDVVRLANVAVNPSLGETFDATTPAGWEEQAK